MLCAGKTKYIRANTCSGDSGGELNLKKFNFKGSDIEYLGPLVCEGNYDLSGSSKWFIFGITSYGAIDCAKASVYTKVINYVKWIRGIMGITYQNQFNRTTFI